MVEEQKIPETMNSIVLVSKGEVDFAQIPVPKPEAHQLLVKIECATLNPSDMLFLKAATGMRPKEYPFTPGWEGAGVVVQAGSDNDYAKSLIGKRVAVMRGNDAVPGVMTTGGIYADYAVCDTMKVVPLPEHISNEEGASFFVNPMTAIGMVRRSKELGASSIIMNAACSQLCRMIIKLCQREEYNITPICVVRRQEQVDILKDMGVKNIVNSSAEDYEAQMT
mmetsp:Transcript_34091/g.24593  ORF Transcript_34091/g.24593 Transcript_34091/m.24593 type:complete len:223 (+) Transcript_34091:38-706(+)